MSITLSDAIAFSQPFPGSVCRATYVDHAPGAACRGAAIARVMALGPYVVRMEGVAWIMAGVARLPLVPALLAEVHALAAHTFIPVRHYIYITFDPIAQ